MERESLEVDVLYVGAGAAALASAISLKRKLKAAGKDATILVLEKAEEIGNHQLSGAVMDMRALRELEPDFDKLGFPSETEVKDDEMRFLTKNGSYPARGVLIPAPFQNHGNRIVSLYKVVRWLKDLAEKEGIDVYPGFPADSLLEENGRVVGVRTRGGGDRAQSLRAPLVVAADGRASVIAHRLGCRAPHRLRRMALATYISGVKDCRDHGEIFIDPPDYSILNPIAPDRINLSLVVPLADAAPWSGRLETFFTARVKHLRHLAPRVAGARLEAPVQAMGPLAYRVFAPRVGGVLLVGDAAGFYDPFTGEGIFSALRGAELAAETVARALDAGDVSARALAGYLHARRAAFADKAHVTRALQMIIRRRWLANLTGRLLSSRPAVLDLLLGVVGDYVPPRALLRPLAAE